MPNRVVTIKGESSTRKEPRRLRLEALADGLVRVRIHNPENSSGLSFDVPRASLDRLVGPGPVPAVESAVVGTTATAHFAVRRDLHAYVWVRTPGDDGWDVLVMQSQLARKMAELSRP